MYIYILYTYKYTYTYNIHVYQMSKKATKIFKMYIFVLRKCVCVYVCVFLLSPDSDPKLIYFFSWSNNYILLWTSWRKITGLPWIHVDTAGTYNFKTGIEVGNRWGIWIEFSVFFPKADAILKWILRNNGAVNSCYFYIFWVYVSYLSPHGVVVFISISFIFFSYY